VPAAIRLQEEYGDKIQVLLVECQGSDDQAIVDKQLMYKWLGGNTAWTKERPFHVESPGLPYFALLDADGKIVMSGLTNSMHTQIKESIAEMVKNSKKASGDLPKPVGKAMVDVRKGDYAKANAVLNKLIAKPGGPDPAALQTAAQTAQGQLMARAEGEVKRAVWMAKNGYPVAAVDLNKSLLKRAKGLPGIQDQMAELNELLTSDEMKAEIAAAKELNKLELKFYDDYKGKFKKKFQKIVEKYGHTAVANRATYWAQFAK